VSIYAVKVVEVTNYNKVVEVCRKTAPAKSVIIGDIAGSKQGHGDSPSFKTERASLPDGWGTLGAMLFYQLNLGRHILNAILNRLGCNPQK